MKHVLSLPFGRLFLLGPSASVFLRVPNIPTHRSVTGVCAAGRLLALMVE